MSRHRSRFVMLTVLTLTPLLATSTVPTANASDLPANSPPQWIWLGAKAKDGQTVSFRKEFQLDGPIKAAKLVASGDDSVAVFLDGKPVVQGDGWSTPVFHDLTNVLQRGPNQGVGRHVLAARCRNGKSAAGLLLRLVVEPAQGKPFAIISDASWNASESTAKNWAAPGFDDQSWTKATVVANLGGAPWSVVNEAALANASRRVEPTATDPNSLKVAKGFKVELLYTVPKETQGSWVSMTVDPKGRLIVSDQYGKLYRVTPSPIGESSRETKIEPIDVKIGEAQGMTWAFDSLYVVVNKGATYPSGLYRVRDTDGDDHLDTVEPLRMLNGGGEHGPHAVIPSPDGKSLYVVAGNATQLTELAGSLVPRLWDEDQILPYLLDGRGFMRDERAPGGCIYRVSPDGKEWTLVSMGYRNPYDLAFNAHGDLFTYDSDMEWDFNTPWYRPTRVCQADSGSDFGYRNGSGKWPTYFPDSLPPTLNIGPGSPTGITFGYGAKFPAAYQNALFISDWSYGKLYAIHMVPQGSAYRASSEEFITGTPLPLTDLVINPNDQAMYITIGGRRTLSGLYRVTYAGDESTAPARMNDPGEAPRAQRRMLESFHGRKDPGAVDAAWPFLGHADRFLRYAARVAIEHQDPKTWQDRALAETNPQDSLTALLALARAGDPSLQPRLLESLHRLNWDALSLDQKLELLRVTGLAFIRMGAPDAATASREIQRFSPHFPAKGRELNAELCKLLVYLQAPDAAAKTMALLAEAPTQEEQIEYAVALRKLKTGWTPDLRSAYFSWFNKAAHFKGGASLDGFLRQIKDDALAALTPDEKLALKPVLDAAAEPKTAAPAAPSRPFVKEWTVEELAPLVEQNLKDRDFDRGRSLFAAASCFSCHRFANEGGATGPDLTGVAGRFSPRDLLESIILPSKSVSDQYQAVNIVTTDGRVVTGRIVNLHDNTMSILTDMLDPNGLVTVDRRQVEEMKPSTVSMMPEGLLNTLKKDEVLDLMAYLLAGGDRSHALYQARAK